jgi:hypothetical protein
MKKTLNDFKHVEVDLFSKVREQSSGDIIPPTKEEFFTIWNKYHGHFEPLDNDKHLVLIMGYTIPDFDEYSKEFNTRTRAITVLAWTRIIISFDMNYEFKRKLGISPNEKIDFIGSTKHKTEFKKDFHGCNVLFIKDSKLEELIRMFEFSYVYKDSYDKDEAQACEEALDYFEKYIRKIHKKL